MIKHKKLLHAFAFIHKIIISSPPVHINSFIPDTNTGLQAFQENYGKYAEAD
jgi:hypothetical protein